MVHDARRDRHTAHISEAEKALAATHLNRAIEAVYGSTGPSPILTELRAAMTSLGIVEWPKP